MSASATQGGHNYQNVGMHSNWQIPQTLKLWMSKTTDPSHLEICTHWPHSFWIHHRTPEGTYSNHFVSWLHGLQCFDTIAWVSGTASDL